MPGSATHRHAIAHGRQQNLILATRLGKPHGVLGTKGIIGGRHQRKPAVQAHHGTELHLLGLLGMCAKVIEGSLLSRIDRQVIKRRNILQRVEPRHTRQQLLGRCRGFGRKLPTTITLSPRPRRLFLRFCLSLAHKRLPAPKITTEQVFSHKKSQSSKRSTGSHTFPQLTVPRGYPKARPPGGVSSERSHSAKREDQRRRNPAGGRAGGKDSLSTYSFSTARMIAL